MLQISEASKNIWKVLQLNLWAFIHIWWNIVPAGTQHCFNVVLTLIFGRDVEQLTTLLISKQPIFNIVSTSKHNVETSSDYNVETTSDFNVDSFKQNQLKVWRCFNIVSIYICLLFLKEFFTQSSYGDPVYNPRRVKCEAKFVSSGSKIV